MTSCLLGSRARRVAALRLLFACAVLGQAGNSIAQEIVGVSPSGENGIVVSDDGSADLGDIAPGSTKSMTLRNSGGNYHCTIHSSMVGSVNGKEAPQPPECNNPGYC